MRRIRKTNPRLISLIRALRRRSHETGAKIWKDIAERLEGPSRNYAEVNVGKIARYASEGETVLIPGKLLGSGEIDFPVTVAALSFSESARKKIREAGGRCIRIEELMEENPEGTGIRIMR
ncbi:MAG: 50S ribosomal protein L18e [Archaeoglobi archaeon]|nr:50S ribosomal protein L18e [Candidatus Mnemosynella bozhongmuii]